VNQRPFSRLGRYLAWGVLKRSLASLVLVAVIYLAIDIVEVKSSSHVSTDEWLLWYGFKLPSLVGLLMPIGLVLGVQLMTATLRKSGEWDAVLASGISPRFIVSRMMVTPLAASLLAALLLLFVGPLMLAVWNAKLTPLPRSRNGPTEAKWVKIERRLVKLDRHREPIVVLERDARGRPTALYRSPRSDAPGAAWTPSDGWSARPMPPHLRTVTAAISRPFEECSRTVLPGATLTIGQLASEILNRRSLGISGALLEAERALRFAVIAACLVLPLTMLLICYRTREPRASRLVASGLCVAVLYWLLASAAWNGVSFGLVPPVGLALLVPLLFVSLALLFAGLRGLCTARAPGWARGSRQR
jgi:hypothetical protein